VPCTEFVPYSLRGSPSSRTGGRGKTFTALLLKGVFLFHHVCSC